MSSNNYHKTHKLFFKLTTDEKLNELLKRADKKTGVLEKHINEQLTNGDYCKSNVTDNCKMIIIDFYNTHRDKQFGRTPMGHITFHIEPENKSMTKSARNFGRIHGQNNLNKQLRYTFKLNRVQIPNANNSIKISIGKTYVKPYLECMKIAIDVLNKYFDLNSEYSLERRLTNYSPYWRDCIPKIVANFSTNSSKKSGNSLRRLTHKKSKWAK
jgi:hypothetical protein